MEIKMIESGSMRPTFGFSYAKSLIFLEGASKVFKNDELGQDIAIIAFPALVALAADPLASLVDTFFIGQLGSVELAAVGVSIAVFNLVSKLLNFPVLNLTTSLVAEEDSTESGHVSEIQLETGLSGSCDVEEKNAFIASEGSHCPMDKNHNSKAIEESTGTQRKTLPAISTGLIVGSILGIFELAFLTLGCGRILDLMGISKDSNMRRPAEQYLWLRSLGSPAVVLSLVVQGVFRGFKDTQTPLFATAFGNIVNMILVPILMFTFGYGVSGSAVATVISQYLISLILLMKLCKKVVLFPPKLGGLQFALFLKNGGLLLARSAAVMLSLTLATSLAARQGAIAMAAHQICMQVWLATSLLSDAIALAGQAIIASALAKGDFELAKGAAFRTLQYVAATQPLNSVAFVFDGLHFGASDFTYAAYSMIVVAVFASGLMLVAASMWGFTGIWLGLTVLMTFRMLTGFLRVGTASGPWKFLRSL
ncbi:hypothetical protein GOP47_0001589 [Adiantum capillus-veneris]|uniref:Protein DETOXIFICATION n=1 Tax=Adiantum capillus-veneris TaxID=13818 RepID=A0A9D4V9U1_ADICA|nr:hypothetical protein GOP47_0001589 [Adiantum capillus-veneris]